MQLQEKQLKANYSGDKKFKNFLKFAIPTLVLEIVAIICLVTYLLILPKNTCTISTDYKKAVVYINDKKTEKVRLKTPEDETEYYFYDFNVYLELPKNATYLVKFVVSSNKYSVTPTTTAERNNSEYTLTVTGGEKTKVMSGVCIRSDKLIKNFKVEVEISITEIPI